MRDWGWGWRWSVVGKAIAFDSISYGFMSWVLQPSANSLGNRWKTAQEFVFLPPTWET